jgi:hypothetical protein
MSCLFFSIVGLGEKEQTQRGACSDAEKESVMTILAILGVVLIVIIILIIV